MINKNTLYQKIFKIFFKTPIYNFLINKNISTDVHNILSDPWEGDSNSGYSILKGYITFFNETISFEKSVWEKNDASKIWKKELHSFVWVSDLRAIGSNESRVFVRQVITDWIKRYNYFHELEWDNHITAKRICSLFGNFNFFFYSADEKFQNTLLKSLCKQANHLIRCKLEFTCGIERIFVLKALILVTLNFKIFDKFHNSFMKLLLKEIALQIDKDGCHYSKAPSKHLLFLKNLLDVKNYLAESKIKIPTELVLIISKMACVTKFFKMSNGLLTNFNNSTPFKRFSINQILMRSNSKIKVPQSLEISGFKKISKNKINLIMDCGNPVPEDTCAGSLSFEFSFGKSQIIVNCGAPYIYNKKWTEAMKSTAAHSTLSIDNINSSDIFYEVGKKNSRLAKVWSSRKYDNNCYWIDSAHSGYKNLFGIIHARKIHIDTNSKLLRGQDVLSQVTKNYSFVAKKYFLRFHLHPSIEVSATGSKKKAILRLPDGCGWEFICSESKIKILESIYLGERQKIYKTNHILISDRIIPEKKIKWLFRLIK